MKGIEEHGFRAILDGEGYPDLDPAVFPPLLGQELCTGDPFHHGEERRDEASLCGGDGVAALAMTGPG